jgi:L-lactate dehydrogenase (cytochrome)
VPRALLRCLCLDGCEPAARRILPKCLYGDVSGGAESDAAVRDNRKALDEYGFVPRVLNDVASRNQTTTLFGKSCASPFGIPPMGSSALCAYRGDLVYARAASALNVPMILSAASLIKLEDVIKENPKAWYQAYLAGMPERIEPLVDRVAAATTRSWSPPMPVPPNRENNIRNGFRPRSRSRRAARTPSPIRAGCSAPSLAPSSITACRISRTWTRTRARRCCQRI